MFETRYVIFDKITEEHVVIYSCSNYNWDSGIAYDEFDNSALFLTEKLANDALQSIERDFLIFGIPSDEIDFEINEINLLSGFAEEVRKKIVSVLGSRITKDSEDVNLAISIIKLLNEKGIL